MLCIPSDYKSIILYEFILREYCQVFYFDWKTKEYMKEVMNEKKRRFQNDDILGYLDSDSHN